MRDTITTIATGIILLLSVLTLPGCARRHAAAPYYEPSPGVRLPLNNSGESPQPRLTVSLDNTHFKIDGHIVSLPMLQTELRQQVAQHSKLEVVVSASKGTRSDRFIEAMDAVQTANPATLLIASGPEHALQPYRLRP